ncbi:metalloprotease family protein [Staphylococcus epidermidis]|uniref:metalloprotease family protein n=1 Tax=Staphylococcus TaxID=1279 RepID=UPI00094A84D7|nr:metalloprotease family protein [Staphylococcus epidermidis]APT17795.1 hypothetical protein BUM85_13140 [Staphylococcus epidermidis]MDS3929999.1 metalloprotease family protein [Staphylococcus epidermidis]
MIEKIKNITFYKLLVLFFKKNYVIFGVPIITLLPYIVVQKKEFLLFFINISIIFYLGLILSFILHEYLHIVLLKKDYGEDYIEIRFSVLKISLLPHVNKIKNKVLIKVALIPLLILFIIGIILVIFSYIINYSSIKINGFIFILHIINAFPPLGDGMMIMKALLNLKNNERR